MMLPTDGTILLNAGTMSPTPRPVFDEATKIRVEQASNPHQFFFERQGVYVAAARKALARYLGVNGSELFLLPNVTIALNFAIHAIDVAVREKRMKRDTVLISSLEYGSIAQTWKNAASLTLEVVPIHLCGSWDEIVDAFRKRINARTAALCFSHIAQPNGRVLPVEALVRLARENGVLSVIDGAHTPGMLPLDLESIGADAYGANVHKWMMGLANSGFLHVSGQMKAMLRPLLVSWGSKDLRNDNRDTFNPFYGGTQLQGAIEFWGCVDRVPQMVLPHTIDFLKLVDESRMRKRMAVLSDSVSRQLSPLLEPVIFNDPQRAVALTAFKLPDVDRQAVRRWFAKRNLALGFTRLREDVEGRNDDVRVPEDKTVFLRVSTAWFTTEAEIELLRDAVARWKRSFSKR